MAQVITFEDIIAQAAALNNEDIKLEELHKLDVDVDGVVKAGYTLTTEAIKVLKGQDDFNPLTLAVMMFNVGFELSAFLMAKRYSGVE